MKNSLSHNPTTFKKSTQSITRLLDNHFDKNVHDKPWISPGWLPDYKYNYDVSGLGYIMNKGRSLKNLKEMHELQQNAKSLSNFRNFREYESMHVHEIIVTIEYCTNCKDHSNTTRHDEEKYLNYALGLKRAILTQNPIIKVLLKPLIWGENEKTVEVIYLRSRIGAFEVQLCSRTPKEIIKKTLFSKLETKTWPSFDQILEDIAKYMPTYNINIKLIDPNNELSEEEKIEKLKGIKAILRNQRINTKSMLPSLDHNDSTSTILRIQGIGTMDSRYNTGRNQEFWNGHGSGNIQVSNGTSRPASTNQRPKSSYSTVSSKSISSTILMKSHISNNELIQTESKHTLTRSSLNKAGPGVNGSHDPLSSASIRVYKQESNETGIVVFKNIPLDIYTCEILETKDYLPMTQQFNLFEILDSQSQCNPINIEINLNEQILAFCLILPMKDGVNITEAMVSITKVGGNDAKNSILKETSPKSGKYEFLTEPGKYTLRILKQGYRELIQEITTKKGSNKFIIQMIAGDNTQIIDQAPQKSEEKSIRPVSAIKPIGLMNNNNNRPMTASLPKDENKVIESSIKLAKDENKEIDSSANKANKDENKPVDTSAKVQEENKSMKNASVVVNNPEKSEPEIKKEAKVVPNKQDRVKSAMIKKNEFLVIDSETNEPVKGATVMIDEIGFKGQTDEEGKCIYPINKLNIGNLVISDNRYYIINEEYGGESELDIKTQSDLRFLLTSRPENINEIQIKFLVDDLPPKALNVYVLSSQNKNATDMVKIQYFNTGSICIRFTNTKQMEGIYRIIADIANPMAVFQSDIQLVIAQYDQYDHLPVPKVFEHHISEKGDIYWDLGFFQMPSTQFFEINAYTPKQIDNVNYFLKEYQSLLTFLKNSNKKIDLKTIISGSQKKPKLTPDGDLIVTKKQIYQGLDKYAFEIKNIDHILSSAMIDADIYSYRELDRKLKNLHGPFNFVNLESQGSDSSKNKKSRDDDDEDDVEYIDDEEL